MIGPTEKDKQRMLLAGKIADFCKKDGDEQPVCACMGPSCGRLNCGTFWSLVLQRQETVSHLFGKYYSQASKELWDERREK